MLEIRVDNERLDIGKVSITFELLNPIFNDIGSFSYPFSLPATAKNKSLLQFPGRVNYSGNKKSFAASVFLNGMIWKRGKLIITDTNRDLIKAYFTVGEGYFYSILKNTNLFDLDLGGDRSYYYDYYDNDPGSLTQGPFGKVYPYSYPEVDFAIFPFHMPNFYENSAKGQYLLDNFEGKVNYFTYPSHLFSHEYNTFVIFPFLNYVVDQVFVKSGLKENYNALKHDNALKNIALFNLNTEYAWHADDLIDGFRLDRINLRDYMPDMGSIDLFNHLENVFRCFVFYNEFDNTIDLKLFKEIINNSQVINLNFPYRIKSLSPNDYDGYEVEYDIDSDDEFAKDYFKSIDQFNYKGEVTTSSILPSTGNSFLDMYFIIDIHKYKYWMINSVNPNLGTWEVYSSDRDKFKSGNGKIKINIPGVFCRETYLATCGNEGHWQEVDRDYSPAKAPEFRMIFYHGIVENKPFGSPFNQDESGNVISNYSLEWDGDYGLKNKFHKEFLMFQENTKKIEINMQLNASILKNLDFSKKYRFANANWLLDTVKIQVTNDKISPAEVTAWKV